MTDHKYLTHAYIGGAVAAILFRLWPASEKPSVFDLILALIAVCAIVGAYLSVARSNADAGLKAANHRRRGRGRRACASHLVSLIV